MPSALEPDYRAIEDTLATWREAILVPRSEDAQRVQRRLDSQTKPRRSLGKLESLACQLAQMQGGEAPRADVVRVIVMGADHGIATQNVSAYPQEVTAQMLLNFAQGGAAINAIAGSVGADVEILDLGVAQDVDWPAPILNRKVAYGTRDFSHGDAMSALELLRALEVGVERARAAKQEGVDILVLGEMGIGNTSSATALTAAYTGHDVRELVGRGTGADDETFARKSKLLVEALRLHGDFIQDSAIETLRRLGGFEIAGLAGVIIGAAQCQLPVVLDGLISSVAGLAAAKILPSVQPYLIASHRSVEPAHRVILEALGLEAHFDLELRLGEGTGGALLVSWLKAAVCVYREMATFDDAQVTDTGA